MSMTGAVMKKLLAITFLSMGIAAPLSAAPIVGTLNLTGNVTVTATTIDWSSADGIANLAKVGAADGYFEHLEDLGITPSYASSVDLTAPTVFPVDDFLRDFHENPDVVSESDNLTFDLDTIVAPTAPPCTGLEAENVACSFGVFTLTQTPGGNVDVRMDITGTWEDPQFDDTPATGIYTTQLANTNIATILATIIGGGSINADYSAQITSVPEPATLLTFGAGSLVLAAHRRRRAQKAAKA